MLIDELIAAEIKTFVTSDRDFMQDEFATDAFQFKGESEVTDLDLFPGVLVSVESVSLPSPSPYFGSTERVARVITTAYADNASAAEFDDETAVAVARFLAAASRHVLGMPRAYGDVRVIESILAPSDARPLRRAATENGYVAEDSFDLLLNKDPDLISLT